MWDEIIFPFPNFNGCTVEVWEWISNSIPHFKRHVITYACWEGTWRRWDKADNYANPIYGVATVCHQVRCLRWGHPSLFHTATSLLIWYKLFCVRDILNRLIWMHRRCGFNIKPFCSDVCGDHRRPQTLAEICRTMGICCGFRAVGARVKYPGPM